MRRTKKISGQRGAMLLELALVLPLLLLIVMLVLSLTLVVRTHQVLNNAAREGARLAVQPENKGNTADITTQVSNYASQNGVTITAGNVTINQNALIANGATSISASIVTVDYTYSPNFVAVLALLGAPTSFQLEGKAEFRNFY